MSGAKVLDRYYVPADGAVTVKDVMRMIQLVKKIPAWKTGLLHGDSMLEPNVPIMDLMEDEWYLDLSMLKRDAASLIGLSQRIPFDRQAWNEVFHREELQQQGNLPRRRNEEPGITSPLFPLPWCGTRPGEDAGFKLTFRPRGQGIGQTHLLITPRNTTLDFIDMDIRFGRLPKRRLIYRQTKCREETFDIHSLACYTYQEMAGLPLDEDIKCRIKVYLTSQIPEIVPDQPQFWEASGDGIMHWDLRQTFLGSRPLPKGLPLVRRGVCNVTEADGHVQEIEMIVSFFPGGCKKAKSNQVSLWIDPLCGVEDRKYRIMVDDYWKIADHASVTHWERKQGFGNIRITVLPLGEKRKPGRRIYWPSMEVGRDVRHMDDRRDDGELWLETPVH
eukprot:CAMPEP_0206511518 /NCGR_PEP_ID=MMETSP0324_2-20121206/60334_1 /ASSEMBLY_ACC=CAM_ASM_000836 /TAXON_ID=2866 /ORGANISM="Crypthecodinium cohnii, Strain Seligo" /LENGTH=388 /DNA_ID=CAMNT_0054003305 /DNA_START=115 /DNA_END=1282 /DNA_ORIENTATION=+